MASRVKQYTFYEFFAGGGMVTAGLGSRWKCLFANDIDVKKAATYTENWGGEALQIGNIEKVQASDLPEQVDVSWASFPCQDLSLAGAGAGLHGGRSGTFWPFWQLMRDLGARGRPPRVILLENVYGALTSHSGQDFVEICRALSSGGYQYGAMVIDASYFVPQSRPRLFFIGVHKSMSIPDDLKADEPDETWTPKSLRVAFSLVPDEVKADWIWWNLPKPPMRNIGFIDVIEEMPMTVDWHSREETARLLSMMSDRNLAKVENAKKAGQRVVGGLYRRTRNGKQRAEVRFDNIAGCLRTPRGGSSRQSILVIDGDNIKSRLLSSREAARLMGLTEEYRLPNRYNDAYHVCGDGVVVPVVRHLADSIIEPLLCAFNARIPVAAE